jgi:F-type H+-transporting ATPase subunit gamma
MAKMREIKRRIKSIESTRQITKTMEMVSAAKIKKAQERIEAARPYALKMMDVLFNVAQHVPAVTHPLLEVREPFKHTTIVVFTSNRGLCGGFNANLIRRGMAIFEREVAEKRKVSFVTIGRKGLVVLRFREYPIIKSYLDISDQPRINEAREVARYLMDLYISRKTDQIYLLYNHFKSLLEQKPMEQVLLPITERELDKTPLKRPGTEYLFEPAAQEVLEKLLPTYVETVVFRALLESAASEHAARRSAMKRATNNAGEMLQDLRRSFNKARQAQITQEIAEIVGGAAGLERV